MELNKLLQEVQSINHRLDRVNHVISQREKYGLELVIAIGNNISINATADIDFLYEALLTQREVLTERKEKLSEAVEVAQKVVAGLLAE
ncbi:hypothetical protein AXW37_12380 [Yersinia ruckeri]|uniref:Uncharacterized protein n=2 Tax=Yersinia TaxID=629 RepID=A0AAD2Z9L2_YEREN|nr:MULTISPECIES: hypothetical protein [Yersinia]EKN3828361.1 hypothetical protein [Yersinia enterocolitica]ARZ01854.1 hypothetical protein QMA0440_02532 [Yersinia ruckeri]EKN3986982.1 hypothetical protein [Yersinia enterocolitica]EKN4029025.1 hypothetical protein [Yersinia enterocolitica]EKN4826786.1 hypothetical protein [Yersinia enterocolitica]